ncbi:hypothetical protein [Streptomyces lavenduligriseus]|uniref:Uncharacterized protein n=1 Tax=Streptomyces lavenduligriseus TaxID=67315 RepID=A0ABT0P4D1_9ACTN|nr:hypothetical protein [Streptomyces lavenduligriseus]MCL3998216.1 hypothetical protein [Streptomyces lavenduligriseus]
MSSETDTVQVDPQQLPADSFTDSDLVRIALVASAASNAYLLSEYAQMVSEDQAQAGDYVRRVGLLHANDELMERAVVAERVRGTSWEVLAEALRVTPEEAEEKWGGAEARWRRGTPVTSVLRKNPGHFAAVADRYITTDKPSVLAAAERRPLSASLDAAAHLTGRDVAAADRAFAGISACKHCGH